MLDVTRDELVKYNALSPSVNHHIQRIIDTLPAPDVPYSMKAVIAVAQLTNFASQFRRNIQLVDETLVPINAISFIVAGSGFG
jgi:hypothetical protein